MSKRRGRVFNNASEIVQIVRENTRSNTPEPMMDVIHSSIKILIGNATFVVLLPNHPCIWKNSLL